MTMATPDGRGLASLTYRLMILGMVAGVGCEDAPSTFADAAAVGDAGAADAAMDVDAGAADAAMDVDASAALDAGDDASANLDASLDAAVTFDRFVSPSGTDAGNDCTVEAAPCRTIARGATLAVAGETVWLLDGAYTSTSQGASAVPVAGDVIRARNPGLAMLRISLDLTDATVIDLSIEGGALRAVGGTSVLEGIRLVGAFTSSAQAITASGSAVVTLRPGTVANYAAGATGGTFGAGSLIAVSGTAQLVVEGGTFAGPGVGGTGQSAGGGGAIDVFDDARVTLTGVTMRVNTRGITLRGRARLTMSGCTLEAASVTSTAWGILVFNGSGDVASVTLTDSTVRGFAYLGSSAPIRVADLQGTNQPRAALVLTNTTLSQSSLGVYVDGASTATIDGTGLQIRDNLFGGVRADGALDLAMTGGAVTGNAWYTTTGVASFHGGIWLGAARAYALRLRGVSITDNRSTVANGNVDSGGITVAGTAGSAFDLGTAASPGGNTITGNTTGGVTTGLSVKPSAGVIVSAVGNTFAAGVQGANPSGQYVLGSPPCGATACDLSSGTGENYRVTSGVVRLAQ